MDLTGNCIQSWYSVYNMAVNSCACMMDKPRKSLERQVRAKEYLRSDSASFIYHHYLEGYYRQPYFVYGDVTRMWWRANYDVWILLLNQWHFKYLQFVKPWTYFVLSIHNYVRSFANFCLLKGYSDENHFEPWPYHRPSSELRENYLQIYVTQAQMSSHIPAIEIYFFNRLPTVQVLLPTSYTTLSTCRVHWDIFFLLSLLYP